MIVKTAETKTNPSTRTDRVDAAIFAVLVCEESWPFIDTIDFDGLDDDSRVLFLEWEQLRRAGQSLDDLSLLTERALSRVTDAMTRPSWTRFRATDAETYLRGLCCV